MKLRPMPGIVIVKPTEDTTSLIITNQNQTRLLKGKVIAVGSNVDQGDIKRNMQDYVKVNEIVYFLSYEGAYDHAIINNEKYYMVKCDDLRAAL